MIDYVVTALVVLIAAGAAFYIYKAKKKGQKCIGCPYGKECSGNCGGAQTHNE